MDDNIYLSQNFEVIWTRLKISPSPPHQKFLTATPKVALSTAFTQTWKHGYFHSSETESAFKNQSWFALSQLWPIQIGWFGSNFQMECRPPKGAESHRIVPRIIQCTSHQILKSGTSGCIWKFLLATSEFLTATSKVWSTTFPQIWNSWYFHSYDTEIPVSIHLAV